MTSEIDFKYTNRLINETSPYLLQHAHNPVDWYPWCDEAFERATSENKLVLISIGYSACHWCHVMERETFENEQVAMFMNSGFICIKVDREERPDIDQVYMNAVQLMTGQGGWPLNCFALPNGKPIYGGTYFPINRWKNVLTSLLEMSQNDSEKMKEYSEKLTRGIIQTDLVSLNTDAEFEGSQALIKSVENWKKDFDNEQGGAKRAPKFPLPNNYIFLLRYAALMNDQVVLKHVNLTLDKMAKGGIFDQIGGGFARYSTDMLWKVPHFEKMLYDNAQLVSLYAEAFQATGNMLYKEIVYKTVAFVERELMAPNGAFYAAIDADSQGEEGKFYVWDSQELELLLMDDYPFAKDYYNVNQTGYWEHGQYILMRNMTDAEMAVKWNVSEVEIKLKVESINEKLYHVRSKRPKPALDDKILTSWNALMLNALIDAYSVFNDPYFLKLAERNADFIITFQKKNDHSLFHSHKNGKSSITGFLEDYAFLIAAFISFYEVTFNEKWIYEAKILTDYVRDNFYDEQTEMFFFTAKNEKPLIARKIELSDNVTPASNSCLANSLFKLSRIFDLPEFETSANKMLNKVISNFVDYGSGYSNWGNLMLKIYLPFSELIICAADAIQKRREFNLSYYPNSLFAGSSEPSKLPLLANRFEHNKELIFVCKDKTCNFPVSDVKDALQLLNK